MYFTSDLIDEEKDAAGTRQIQVNWMAKEREREVKKGIYRRLLMLS